MAGYPPHGGYPTQDPLGYPPSGGQSGYPPQGPMGYPEPGGQSGYPPQGPMGYPGPGGQSGYPPQGPMSYPGPGGQSGYPPQGPISYAGPGGQSGYSPQGQMGYPPSGAQSSFGGPANAGGYGGGGGGGGGGGSGGAYSGSGGFGGGMGSSSAYYRGRPTVVPSANFDPGKDAEDLRQAMRGLGTDEGRIISILSKRSFDQRVEIARKYMASFGKDLEKHLKSELSGKFEDVVLYSIDSLGGMLAATIFKAIDGGGTNETILIQALVPYPNAVVRATVSAYKTKFGRDVVKDVRGDTSGDFEKILVALLQAQREENAPVDMGRVAADAEALYKAGEKRLGTEEAVFTRILTQRSFEQIRAISACYQQKYGNTLQKAIKKETSGYYKETMLAIVAFAEDKNGLLAEWLYKSMAGLGTSDTSLMQLVLGRSEIDLQDVKEAYQRKYNKSLVKAIEGDTSGDYKRMLVALVGS